MFTSMQDFFKYYIYIVWNNIKIYIEVQRSRLVKDAKFHMAWGVNNVNVERN